ncbi:hypothetical protein PAXINDRAFT_19901 [Paxillus involutus ATCC 200175]|uniref:Uncharacterized protein n=1 Tax=Paxillus involutus ATCC 200175 TaxID=664439 RepID=A0A0C9TFL8_PAXIN|nr:hypothetical protein PAXINDRAFT_19901 [Paxillus involutus ATCC 200175]
MAAIQTITMMFIRKYYSDIMSDGGEEVFNLALEEVRDRGIIPNGYSVEQSEWTNGSYPEIEIIKVGRGSKDYHLDLPLPKTTTQTAHEEAAAGFRKQENGAVASGSALHMVTRFGTSKSAKTTNSVAGPSLSQAIRPAAQEKSVKIGSLLMIPDGFDEDGTLVGERRPSKSALENFVGYGLLVREDEGKDLEFLVSWSMDAIDIWLRRLLQKPFQWLDACCGLPAAGEYHWVLLGFDRQKYFVITRATTTGKDLDQAKGTTGRKYTTHSIVIGKEAAGFGLGYAELNQIVFAAPRCLIPRSAYTDWDNAITKAMAGELEDEDLGGNLSDDHQAFCQRKFKDHIEGLSALRPVPFRNYRQAVVNSSTGRTMLTCTDTRKAKQVVPTSTSGLNMPNVSTDWFVESDLDTDLDIGHQPLPLRKHHRDVSIAQDINRKDKGKARCVELEVDLSSKSSSVEILEGNHSTGIAHSCSLSQQGAHGGSRPSVLPLFSPESVSDDGNFFLKLKECEDEFKNERLMLEDAHLQGPLDSSDVGFAAEPGMAAVDSDFQSAPVMTEPIECQCRKRWASVLFESGTSLEGHTLKRRKQNIEDNVQLESPPNAFQVGSPTPAESILDGTGTSSAPAPVSPGPSHSGLAVQLGQRQPSGIGSTETSPVTHFSVPIIPPPHPSRRSSAFKPTTKPLCNPWA